MNVQPMQMDPRIAKIHYQDYHKKVLEHRAVRARKIAEKIVEARAERSRLEREDEELMRAYKAMADGNRIINLPHVLKAAGVQPKTHYPALAIARADWKQCHFRVDHGAAWFTEEEWLAWNKRKPGPRVIRVPQATYPAETTNTHWRSQNNIPGYPTKAMVPTIPAHLRPSALDEVYILWDAVWAPAPPIDPLLLKRVSETVFVVVAQWDLTPLEQSILEGRIG